MRWPFRKASAPEPEGRLDVSPGDTKLAAPADGEKTATTYTEAFLSGLPLDGFGTSVTSAYEKSWIAYACIRRLAQDAAGVPMLFLADPADPEREVPPDNPTRRMFERPGPWFSRSELVQWIVTFLNTRGEFFLPFDNPIIPTALVPQTDPLNWREIVEGWEMLGWEYRAGAVFERLLPEELIHHRLVNPRRPFRGQSPLTAAARAFGIEVGSDVLTENIVNRGGERSMVLSSEMEVTRQQRDQALAELRARRSGSGRVAGDVLLPNGVKPLKAEFLNSDMQVLQAGAMQPDKIAAVYGVPRSLLGFEDVDKFATFQGRKRMYYTDTLMPMLTGISAAFDRMFVDGALPSKYRCFIRWNWSAVPAMQEDISDLFRTAGRAVRDGIPWAVANERFKLGLDPANIPGSDTVMVSSTLAPLDKLVEEWNNPAPTPDTPTGGAGKSGGSHASDRAAPRLSNATLYKRATNAREIVRRGQRLLKLERGFADAWRREIRATMAAAKKLLAGDLPGTNKAMRAKLSPAFSGLGDRLAKTATPLYEAAAMEGEQSIVELVEGKLADTERDLWRKAHKWRPDTARMLQNRVNRTVPKIADDLFDDVIRACARSVMDGNEVDEVRQVLVQRMGSAPGGLNRSVTIARTEVGTAYNTARFSEMRGQGFKKHRWLTAGDEKVRTFEDGDYDHAVCDDVAVEVGEAFPCGLTHPMQDGGAAGNVINCRCETIPYVEA